MQEINQQEIDMVGGGLWNPLVAIPTALVLGAQQAIGTVGAAALNFGVNLTDTAGGLLNGLVNDIVGIVAGTGKVITG